jgi:hypothetical protein
VHRRNRRLRLPRLGWGGFGRLRARGGLRRGFAAQYQQRQAAGLGQWFGGGFALMDADQLEAVPTHVFERDQQIRNRHRAESLQVDHDRHVAHQLGRLCHAGAQRGVEFRGVNGVQAEDRDQHHPALEFNGAQGRSPCAGSVRRHGAPKRTGSGASTDPASAHCIVSRP